MVCGLQDDENYQQSNDQVVYNTPLKYQSLQAVRRVVQMGNLRAVV